MLKVFCEKTPSTDNFPPTIATILKNYYPALRWERRASINFKGTGSIEVFHPPFSMSGRQSLAEEGMQHHRSHLRQ
ncbi:unnamed protein product, partial [Nesidiocoris tenuis]